MGRWDYWEKSERSITVCLRAAFRLFISTGVIPGKNVLQGKRDWADVCLENIYKRLTLLLQAHKAVDALGEISCLYYIEVCHSSSKLKLFHMNIYIYNLDFSAQ